MEETEMTGAQPVEGQTVGAPAAPDTPAAHGAPDAPDTVGELAALRGEMADLRRRWEDFLAGSASARVQTEKTPGPAGNSPEPVYGAAQIRGMSAAQINARWDDIRRSMGRRQ